MLFRSRVNAILIQPDNNILIGGDFNLVNGVPRLALARLLGSDRGVVTPTISAMGTATGIRLTFTGTLYSATNVEGTYLLRPNAPGPTLEVPFSNSTIEFFQTR